MFGHRRASLEVDRAQLSPSPSASTDSGPRSIAASLPSAEGLYLADRLGVDESACRPALAAAAPMLLVGRGGQQILRGPRIGHGGFTKIYLGMDEEERLVAVRVRRLPEREAISLALKGPQPHKVRRTEVVDPDELASELRLSALAGASLHPSDGGCGMGRAFDFVELMLGDGLAAFEAVEDHGSRGDLTRLIGRMLLDGSRALAAAHAVGVLHNDVKPENFLVDRRGQLHLSDFGLAASLPPGASGVPTGGGTRAYAAPEALGRGGQQSPASDVWSLAASAAALALGEDDGLLLARSALRARLHRLMGATCAAFVVDQMGATNPAARPTASACAETFAGLLPAPGRLGAAAETFYLRPPEEGHARQIARLRGGWDALRAAMSPSPSPSPPPLN